LDICSRRVLMVRSSISLVIAVSSTLIAFRVEIDPVTGLASVISSIVNIGVWAINAAISMISLALLTRSLVVCTAMSLWLLEIGFLKLASTIPIFMVVSSWLAITLTMIVMASTRGGVGDSVLDTRSWRLSPLITPLPLGLLTSLLVVRVMEMPLLPAIIHLASSAASAVVASLYSHNLAEATALGVAAGLGPLGLVVIGARVAFSRINPGVCEGLVIGKLVAVEDSGSRAKMATAHGSLFTLKGTGLLCTRQADAVLALRGSRKLIWVYGRPSKNLLSLIAPKPALIIKMGREAHARDPEEMLSEISSIISSGGTAEAILDPSQAQLAVGVAEALIDVAKESGVKSVVIEVTGLSEEHVLRLAKKATRSIEVTVVQLNNVPWTGPSLMPRFHADSSGIIVTSLEDPGDRVKIVSSLFTSSWSQSIARRLLASPKYGVAYPYCGDKPLIFLIYK